MNYRVHPNHESKYRVQNWADYSKGLVMRGSVKLWLTPEAIAAWKSQRLLLILGRCVPAP